MFCPSCGKTVAGGLKYCNNCGERLAGDEDTEGTPGKMLDNILTALFLIVMFGMGILVGLVAVLLDKEVKTEVVTLIVIAYLASIFGICISLAWQVPKLINAKLKSLDRLPPAPAQHQLPATPAAVQIDAYRDPAMSVTEHTTRTLVDAKERDR